MALAAGFARLTGRTETSPDSLRLPGVGVRRGSLASAGFAGGIHQQYEFGPDHYGAFILELGGPELATAYGYPGQNSRWTDYSASAIAAREDARKRKDFKESDRIRDELLAQGIVLEDTAKGVVWKRK